MMETTETPLLTQTYHTGTTLQLYKHPVPDRPGLHTLWIPFDQPIPDVNDRYAKSVAERITLPSTPPDVTITLTNELSTGRACVWTAVEHKSSAASSPDATPIIAKIFDPVFFGTHREDDTNAFAVCDFSVSKEVESYDRLKPFQGTKIPRFYGHFIAPLPSQHNRTISIILLEYVEGRDLRRLVPEDVADKVCNVHKEAIVDAVINLHLDLLDYGGVFLTDLRPRNVLLKIPKVSTGHQYCIMPQCPLRLVADCNNLDMIMIDLENVRYFDRAFHLDDPKVRAKVREGHKRSMMVDWL